jgi:hypothetical protein
MTYLDYARLNAIDTATFRSQKPYPWINPEGLLTKVGYQRLRETLPDVTGFTPEFGKSRIDGKPSHDRFALEYHDDLNVPQPWKEFVAELRGKKYQVFLRRLLNVRSFKLRFHWHYTPNGCSVSPHNDVELKLGSHIFYFNTPQDWNPDWGGETLILDDGGRFASDSAPHFDDFERVVASEMFGNRSLLFARQGNSWHGVREIRCPEDRMRKVFIVVIDRYVPVSRIQRFWTTNLSALRSLGSQPRR